MVSQSAFHESGKVDEEVKGDPSENELLLQLQQGLDHLLQEFAQINGKLSDLTLKVDTLVVAEQKPDRMPEFTWRLYFKRVRKERAFALMGDVFDEFRSSELFNKLKLATVPCKHEYLTYEGDWRAL